MSILNLLLLFVFGLIVDWFWCRAVQASAMYKAWHATIFTIILTSVQLFANWEIIKNDSVPGFIAFVAGCATGTFAATKRRLKA